MNNIWFQYKIGKQLDELEIEDSLCLSLFKSLENCIKFKKLSNIGLKEAEVKRDAEISRIQWLSNLKFIHSWHFKNHYQNVLERFQTLICRLQNIQRACFTSLWHLGAFFKGFQLDTKSQE
ncbi:hypothetical protein TH0233_12830 [Helicobacter pylori]